MKSFQITEWCHELFLMQAVTGGTYIDATMGNGHDTLFLCRLAGKEGQVLAFDIQKQALESTRALLKSEGMEQKARLILDSHENMAEYADEASVDGICFNFGYLPGSDHSLATKPESSRGWNCIHGTDNMLAGFPHLYYYANPKIPQAFLKKCLEYKELQK